VHNDTDAILTRLYYRYMISTLLIVLVVLWALGLATSYTIGGLIHVLLLIAIVVVLLRVIGGQHPLRG
jgi:4-hydroxybenzoate polyprenyltransferase